ncbi:hypothetical protein BH23ACT5_BH23ACT5_11030 [soil metagenome]
MAEVDAVADFGADSGSIRSDPHEQPPPNDGAVIDRPNLKAAAVIPVVSAIGVFGVIYGAAAT